MNKKIFLFSLALFTLSALAAKAQVIIGSLDEPQDFSILELISNNTRGLRLPQLTQAERDLLDGTETDLSTASFSMPSVKRSLYSVCSFSAGNIEIYFNEFPDKRTIIFLILKIFAAIFALWKIISTFADDKKNMNSKIFNRIRSVKRQILPNERVILFGSQARGDARPDSDWDLLVLLNKPKRESRDFDLYGYPFAEIGLDTGAHISAKVFTETEWAKGKIFPFYKNVMQEGIEIK